ncbi:MAG: hypothetical protein JOZ72_11890 [Alphaproteobacteria bacterium]|nr:hypothetical protein [Alphaproteobacteria bacterium]
MRQHRQLDPDAAAIIGEPRWFPIDLDEQTGAIRFADVGAGGPGWHDLLDVGAGNKTLLAQRCLSASAAFRFVADDSARPRINFIWHSAYCCSTAIAAALDVAGRNRSLFEPQILARVAQMRRRADRTHRGDISWLSDAVFRLLSRPRADGAAVTLKPAPASNYLVADAAAKTDGKMLFLASDCRSFLLACMRYGENRRRFVRGLFNEIRGDDETAQRWTPGAVAGLTDLEIAGLTWQLQVARFSRDLKRLGDRAASLDSRTFLSNPRETIARIWRFLELPGEASESPAIRDDVYLHRHSKYGDEPFTPEAGLAAGRDLDPEMSKELDRIVEATHALFADPRDALSLPNPLIVSDKADLK